MNPSRPTSRILRAPDGLLIPAPVRVPHCAYCGKTGILRSVKVRGGRALGMTRLDVCGGCRVTKLGFQPERTV